MLLPTAATMAGFPGAHNQGMMLDEDHEGGDAIGKVKPGPAPPGDGYAWKKYGQKFIKRIAMNRSYFKCQRSNCEAKKKVEWSTPDSFVKVAYDGTHNHPPPNSSGATSGASSGEPSPATMDKYNLVYQFFGNSLPLP